MKEHIWVRGGTSMVMSPIEVWRTTWGASNSSAIATNGLQMKQKRGHWTETEQREWVGFRVENLGWVYTRVQAQWHPIGREQDHGSKEFMLGSWSKIWKNDVALMWHHFPSKCRRFHFKRVIVLVWETNSKVGSSLESENKVCLRVFWTTSFLDPNLILNMLSTMNGECRQLVTS